jgi:hypothetical protein
MSFNFLVLNLFLFLSKSVQKRPEDSSQAEKEPEDGDVANPDIAADARAALVDLPPEAAETNR